MEYEPEMKTPQILSALTCVCGGDDVVIRGNGAYDAHCNNCEIVCCAKYHKNDSEAIMCFNKRMRRMRNL